MPLYDSNVTRSLKLSGKAINMMNSENRPICLAGGVVVVTCLGHVFFILSINNLVFLTRSFLYMGQGLQLCYHLPILFLKLLNNLEKIFRGRLIWIMVVVNGIRMDLIGILASSNQNLWGRIVYRPYGGCQILLPKVMWLVKSLANVEWLHWGPTKGFIAQIKNFLRG